MSAEQGDEEEGGLGQAPGAQTEVTSCGITRDCVYLTSVVL